MVNNKIKWGAVALASAFVLAGCTAQQATDSHKSSQATSSSAAVKSSSSTKTDDHSTSATSSSSKSEDKKTGWVADNGSYRYYKDGKPLKGRDYVQLPTINGEGKSWYLVQDGVPQAGVQKWAGSYWYFDSNTYTLHTQRDYLQSQWGDWYLVGENGQILSGVQQWAGTYYYFDPNTYLRVDNNYVQSQWGDWYMFGSDGRIVSGLYEWQGQSYYFDPVTYLKATSQTVVTPSGSYYADENGVLHGGISVGQYGVDVSSFQGTDLSAYANAGATYAVVKVSEGTGYTNPNGRGQIASAQANNLYTMAYHFATFSSDPYAAVAQANFAVQQAQAMGLPAGSYLALDWETGDGNYIYGNTEANTQAILAFMRTVQAAGYKTMLYSGASALRNNVNTSEVLAEFPNSLWVASYPTTSAQWQADMNYFPSMDGVAIWQFADNWAGFGVDGNIAVTNVN